MSENHDAIVTDRKAEGGGCPVAHGTRPAPDAGRRKPRSGGRSG